MEYHKVSTVLKRYSLRSKLIYCNEKSKKNINKFGIKPIVELKDNVYPWEIEELLLHSLMAEDWGVRDLCKDDKVTRELINSIRNFSHPKLLSDKKIDVLTYFMLSHGQNQFPHQRAYITNIWRYFYFFTFNNQSINMKEEFFNKFKCDYQEVMCFGLGVHYLCISGVTSYKFLNSLIEEFSIPFNLLSIDIEEFKTVQRFFTPELIDYKYGFKCFYQYPFIKNKEEYYLPVPHLVMTATTTSLLYRLTEKNNNLMTMFGKNVLESYLLDLLSSFGIYDVVKPEMEYLCNKNLHRSPDVLLKDGDYCILFDSKSFVLSAKTRTFDEKAIKVYCDNIIKAFVQVYKNIKNDFNKYYFPFGESVQFSKNDIFGVIIIRDFLLVDTRELYVKASLKLGIELDSVEYEYLCSNIKIIALDEIEQLFINRKNLTDALRCMRDCKEKRYDITLPNTPKVELKQVDNHFTRTVGKTINIIEAIEELFNINGSA